MFFNSTVPVLSHFARAWDMFNKLVRARAAERRVPVSCAVWKGKD